MNLVRQFEISRSDSILIETETICQIALSHHLQDIVKGLNFKFRLKYSNVELFKVPFENNLSQILEIDSIDLSSLSSLFTNENMWTQFEKCLDKPFVDIFLDIYEVKYDCFIDDRKYFDLRNAFDHWIKGPEKERIQEVKNENLKEKILKDFREN